MTVSLGKHVLSEKLTYLDEGFVFWDPDQGGFCLQAIYERYSTLLRHSECSGVAFFYICNRPKPLRTEDRDPSGNITSSATPLRGS